MYVAVPRNLEETGTKDPSALRVRKEHTLGKWQQQKFLVEDKRTQSFFLSTYFGSIIMRFHHLVSETLIYERETLVESIKELNRL